MNRSLALGLALSTLIWIALWFYPDGESQLLNEVIATGLVLLYTGIVIHMLADRGVSLWTAFSVGVVLGAAGWVALFSLFEYGWRFGSLAPGVGEAWLDVVRALVLVSGAFAGFGLVRERLHRRAGKETIPGALLLPPDVIPRRRADDWERTD